ncbi:hypothetical protein STEG23_008732, partial [Scotinomys teguina]
YQKTHMESYPTKYVEIFVFWTQHGSCTYESTVVVTECTRPSQAQANPNLNLERGVVYESRYLNKELL